ncbi:hypothetical protein COW94_04380 [Candidatus Peregrinibacteria bacterium CG22_combo_CG10-13_8_21_14_all_44_10]|nr:MAG: hypothetical protein AUK45_01160 [Candidatus Peregrinibacteria bacterium CG2_30_44_17]PIP65941.1 MAG: hypothetical protein COW94_04380 [Candidatus Peregrinibacteria bacterium CG22_combo_CG10-13_8_21_14_all_44_10]PIS04156.1 MAG: hypothetical protein COT83_02105 [Candidatus Peregrinibacteria bacterium CG10_big_fil_rev_8_21_14_0_10_44_7]PJB89258.1 MAG: hypothetical protein CO082_01730 [Candidatus Peregrinibacteria bacterium CG_4_9_14_0_8_um_filter_44_15]
MDLVKIVIYTPSDYANSIRSVLAEAGAGNIGNYDSCSFSSKGVGRFRPLDGSSPHTGNIHEITEVDEERIETICPRDKAPDIISKVKAAHPYEEPAIDVYPLLDL